MMKRGAIITVVSLLFLMSTIAWTPRPQRPKPPPFPRPPHAVPINADTLDSLDSTDFAESLHSHPGLPTGVHWISSLEFVSRLVFIGLTNDRPSVSIGPNYITPTYDNTFWPATAWAPVNIPFKCTITEIQFRARDNSDVGDVFVGIYDGTEDPVTEEYVPIAFKDTSEWASTRTYNLFSTGTISLPHNPTDYEFNRQWWIKAELDDINDLQRLRWVRIYYTVP